MGFIIAEGRRGESFEEFRKEIIAIRRIASRSAQGEGQNLAFSTHRI
jgi:hypothetical protein